MKKTKVTITLVTFIALIAVLVTASQDKPAGDTPAGPQPMQTKTQ